MRLEISLKCSKSIANCNLAHTHTKPVSKPVIRYLFDTFILVAVARPKVDMLCFVRTECDPMHVAFRCVVCV